jgi:uncharacterized repeat protein (TIGR02543 family)
LILAFLITGCGPTIGGGNNGSVPIVVTFDAQGGNVHIASKEVTVGSTYGFLPEATWWKHIFKGWYTEPNGGTIIYESSTVTNTENHTFYARWIYYG